MDDEIKDEINSINGETDTIRVLTMVISDLMAGMYPDLNACEMGDLLKILKERAYDLKQRTKKLTKDLGI